MYSPTEALSASPENEQTDAKAIRENEATDILVPRCKCWNGAAITDQHENAKENQKKKPSFTQKENPLIYCCICGQGTVTVEPVSENEEKLLIGLIYSMKSFCQRINPKQQNDKAECNLSSFIPFSVLSTATYKLHYYESPTGYKFICTTDANTRGDMPVLLEYIYKNLFSQHYIKSTAFLFEEKLSYCSSFSNKLIQFLSTLPSF